MTPFFLPSPPPSIPLFLSPSRPLSLSPPPLPLSRRLDSFSSTRSNPGNPFSSRSEIPRRTAFSLLATFYLFLLLSPSFLPFPFLFRTLFIFYLLGANLPPVDDYQRFESNWSLDQISDCPDLLFPSVTYLRYLYY